MARRTVLFGVTTGIVVRSFFGGLLSHLADQGWRVILVSNNDRDARKFADEEGAEFREINSVRNPSPIDDLSTFLALRSIIGDEAPDVCVWGTPKVGLLGTLASRSYCVPTVYVPHGLRYQSAVGFARFALKSVESVACRLASRVYTVGHEVRQTAISDRLVPANRIQVIANGSANGVTPGLPFEGARQKFGLSEGQFVVGFVGRVTADKGVPELLKAWERYQQKDPTSVLIVVGMLEPDAKVGSLGEALGRGRNVVVLGHVDDLTAVYSAIDVLILPSYREGLPTVVLEAASFKVPSIVTDATGVSEPVIDEVTGLVVKVNDVDAIHTALTRYGSSKALCSELGYNAFEFVLERYDRELVHRGWQTALSDLVSEPEKG